MKRICALRDSLEIKLVHSLAKILPFGGEPEEECAGSVLRNQTYNFQVAMRTFAPKGGLVFPRVLGELAPFVYVFTEGLAPATVLPHDADEYYVTRDVTLIPDVFLPSKNGCFLTYGQWRAFWVSVRLDGSVKGGTYQTVIELVGVDGEVVGSVEHTIEVIDVLAPKTDLRLTNWMHYDGICRIHRVEPFTDAFYDVFDGYLREYTESGFNMLLTPLFTVPLDTDFGKERATAQLVDVYFENGAYRFDFARLERFIAFAKARGIEYFEFSHLFTQWGGKYCPKVMVWENGEEQKRFGWETASDSPEYECFLSAFLPKLVEFIERSKIKENSYLHLTDEPEASHYEYYECRRAFVKKYIGDLPTMDAIEHFEYYKRGLIDLPVVHFWGYGDFENNGVKDILVYNCCYPAGEYYSNRFINMPLQRTRVLGCQLYASGVKGYLHWGFNFYNAWRSRYDVDPYAVTDAGGGFPSGDSFIVYPDTEDGFGARGSLRLEAVKEGFQDYCALKLVESAIGREEVCRLLNAWGVKGYTTYPRSAKAHLQFREQINKLVKKLFLTSR